MPFLDVVDVLVFEPIFESRQHSRIHIVVVVVG